jgi:hypothetical protein
LKHREKEGKWVLLGGRDVAVDLWLRSSGGDGRDITCLEHVCEYLSGRRLAGWGRGWGSGRGDRKVDWSRDMLVWIVGVCVLILSSQARVLLV